jgi:hypothetical protein
MSEKRECGYCNPGTCDCFEEDRPPLPKRSGADIVRRTSKTDNYSTPTWAVEAMLKHETFEGYILEPAAGEGNIVRVLREHVLCIPNDRRVFSGDIRPIETCDYHRDFLDPYSYQDKTFGAVVTNPPFSLALPFAQRSLEVASTKVALFLRIQFLESEARRPFLESSPLKNVYIFSKRVSLYPEGSETKGGGTQCFAWFVWEHGYKGRPMIWWVP